MFHTFFVIFSNLTINSLFSMGSSLMRATKSAQRAEPTEATDIPSQQDQIPPMDVPQSTNAEAEQSIPPVVPETGPSPDQDMSNVAPVLDPPPGNWEIGHDDVYTQRQ